MKAIFEGVRYDSDKAELIGEADAGGSVTDFGYWFAGLYRSPRAKRFFLAGEGGPMTRWSRPVDGNTWTGGRGIIPLSEAEAREWAERYLTPEQIEAAFNVEDA